MRYFSRNSEFYEATQPISCQFILFADECLLEGGPMAHEVAGWD